MSINRNIYQVDAFTSEPFRGNPAGVCILDREMPDEWMQDIAAELHVSETAFITRQKEYFGIRFFTPESEVPLCGHATLSSAHIMYEQGIVDINEEINFLAKAGKLGVKYFREHIIMDFPSYDLVQIPDKGDIINLIGTEPVELYRSQHGWTLVLLESEEKVISLNPDFKAMRKSEHGDMIVTAPSVDPAFDFCVRCFAPALGIDEDPVTGSAHCALVPFWHKKSGRREFVSHQVSKRSGILKVAYRDERVEIAGRAKTIFRAELFV